MDNPAVLPDRDTSFSTVREEGIDWIIDASCRPLIPSAALGMLLQPVHGSQSRIIRENKVRRSMLIRIPQLPEELFAKLYKKPAGAEKLKYFLLPSKASSEWKNMLKLYERGLPVARPLARGEIRRRGFLQEAYLFTVALAGAIPLTDFAAGISDFAGRMRLEEKAARLVSEIHNRGFFFRDLHAGNILIVPESGTGYHMWLADFHKAWHTVWVPSWMRARDLAQLRNSLSVSTTGQVRFLKAYLGHANLPPDYLRKLSLQIDHTSKKLWSTHLRSRTRRCLKESSEFSVTAGKGLRVYRHKIYPEGLLDTLLKEHASPSHHNTATLKKTAKETISLLTAAYDGIEYKVVVKEWFCATLLARLRYVLFSSRARRNWIAARALRVRGIPTPDALALVEYRSGLLLKRSLLFTRYVEAAHELNAYVLSRYGGALSSATRQEKKRFIQTLAELIRDMHARGIYHADMKSNNILVREDGDAWKLFIIDLDRVRFRKSLSFKQRANNLAQINASVADCITPADRILFFRHYAKGRLPALESKQYFRQIVAIGRKKNTRPYGLEFNAP